MIIKRISLRNIRSYKNQEINFPESSILLSGDIGSGKTSVLLAIEFALFGLQPGQKGSSILRNGAESGGVEMEFEVDGKNVKIERALKKNKVISQDYCAIEIDGERKEISVMEIKDKVLELLNYPKEFSKKQNMLYKFTVYTPQEEMKQIITEDSESRINTLRHIFGIDKYKTILENTNILVSKIREEKRIKEVLVRDLELEKTSLLIKETELIKKMNDLTILESEFFIKKQETQKIILEKEKVIQKVEERKIIRQEIERTKLEISGKKDIITNNEKLTRMLSVQIQEIEKVKFPDSDFLMLKEKIELKKKEKDELNEKVIESSSEINSLNLKITENNILKNKISHLETCPTCMQVVNENYKMNILKKCEYETEENNKRLSLAVSDKDLHLESSKMLNNEIINLEKRLQELNLIKLRAKDIEDKLLQLKEVQSLNPVLSLEIEFLEKRLVSLQKDFDLLGEFEKTFLEINKIFEEALSSERIAEIRLAETKREVLFFENQIKDIKEKVIRYEKIKHEIINLHEIENWLNQKFSFLIYLIEKNVMTKLKNDFSRFFSEWFSMLVSEIFTTSIEEDFSPKIEQQGYEIDYSYLSGGERTAVALAYRLALNQVINSMLSKIKTKDIVILDEPTDGFSSQQLDRMRDVLSQLNVKQLIIVSHEQKIEAFVETIIRFRKEDGVSKVEF